MARDRSKEEVRDDTPEVEGGPGQRHVGPPERSPREGGPGMANIAEVDTTPVEGGPGRRLREEEEDEEPEPVEGGPGERQRERRDYYEG